MFGHQDEPQQQTDTSPTTPAAEPVPDAVLGALPTDSTAPSMVTPLLDAQAPDGITDPAPNTGSDLPPTAPSLTLPTAAATSTDTLLDIKQQALQQLSPLVGHLDQSPEEKFRTTMMMIQAADNQALIGNAYEAAQAITDEKARAQALLDIVNEINYFTTQGQAK